MYRDRLQQIQREVTLGDRSTLTREQAQKLQNDTVAALDRVILAAPSPQLYVEKAGLFWNHREGAGRSRAILKEGLVRFPGDRLLTVYLANSYVADDRIDDAIGVMGRIFWKSIQATSRSGKSWARCSWDAGRDAEALDVLKGIPEPERGPDALYAMGRVQGNLGMRKAAIANLKKAVAMDPEFTEAQVELAYQYELAKGLCLRRGHLHGHPGAERNLSRSPAAAHQSRPQAEQPGQGAQARPWTARPPRTSSWTRC